MRRLRRQWAKNRKKQLKKAGKITFHQLVFKTGTAALLALSANTINNKAGAAAIPNPHCLPVLNDTDGDFLSDSEENLLPGCSWMNPDANENGLLDGIELAIQCSMRIDSLPRYNGSGPVPTETYVIEYLALGLEHCAVCGETVNMGYLQVINPSLNDSISFPFIGQHYMQHGSFEYDGNIHGRNRMDVPKLVRILELPCCEPHQIPVANDRDRDLISDSEEYGLGTQPFNPDQNQNTIPDGADFAKAVLTKIQGLIASGGEGNIEIFRHEVDGLEQCGICGQWIHMGGTEFTNTRLGLRYPEGDGLLPDLALHYMQHGSLDCLGTVNNGRTEIVRLMRVLEMTLPHDPNEHELPIADLDTDFDSLTDAEEIKAKTNLYNPDQNENLIPDGVELAKQCKRTMDALPRYNGSGSPPTETYAVEALMLGLEECAVCGEIVNMGYMEVIDPNTAESIVVPFISHHYMEHGSFEFDGNVHGRGRIEVNLLLKILKLPRECGDIGTLYRRADLNRDCRVNMEDIVGFADEWLESTEP